MQAENPLDTETSTGRNTNDNVDKDKVIPGFLSFFIVYSNKLVSKFFFNIMFFSVLQVAKLKELSQQPDIYERLTRSLAPNIWELDDVKKGLLCQVITLISD